MTVRNLEFLFRPQSVAVVVDTGAASRYAEVVRRNLAAGGFSGSVFDIVAGRRSRFGIAAGAIRLENFATPPDLAIVCAAPENVVPIIAQLGAAGTRAVIIGPTMGDVMDDGPLREWRLAVLDAARPHLLRVLGPGSGGLAVPARGLHASVATAIPGAGKIAFVAQSTSVAAAVLERACSKGIGFSSVLHLGTAIDVDLADVLDWLAEDPDTEAILVQFDTVPVGRKFMSAARAAARNKPVVAIRGGRVEAGRPAGGPLSIDEIYDAALRRAGWVSIATLGDLFEAAEAMARVRPPGGERLAIIGNGHGLGRIASDTLLREGGKLAKLSRETVRQLHEVLQTRTEIGNPLALPADITPAKWAAALAVVLADRDTDAVLTVCSPSPFAASSEVAAEICRVGRETGRSVFTCWVGGAGMTEAQAIAAANGVLSHDSPEKAIAVFLGIVSYRRNRQLLVQMPPSLAEGFAPDVAAARSAVGEVQANGAMPARHARRLLQAYGIAATEYPLAGSVDDAISVADQIGYPVDIGLVLANAAEGLYKAVGLHSPGDIRIATRGLRSRARAEQPGTRVSGYRLRPSEARSGVAALRLGVAEDAVFGPVIFLGPSAAGGASAGSFVVGLPPLNLVLARDLVARSRFAGDFAAEARAPLEEAIAGALVRLSQLLTDIDEVAAVELDPLHVEATGVVAFDVAIRVVRRGRRSGLRRFAIRPYPKELEKRVVWDGRQLLVRPIRPEDENTLGDLLKSLAPEDSRMRFFDTMRKLPRSQLARFTQIDYDREMALVAIERDADGVERSLGEVRVVADPDNAVADFALVVRSELKGRGLGRLLLQNIVDYARSRGIGLLRGETLAGNLRMQGLARHIGFTETTGTDAGIVDLRLDLNRAGQGGDTEARAPELRSPSR